MQAYGNDYVYVNVAEMPEINWNEVAIQISDRHFGVGGDGLVLVCPSDKADFKMRIFDPDGTEVARLEDVELLAAWTAPLDDSGAPTPLKSGFWSIQFDKPSVGVLEDYIFSIQGVPALLR